MKEDFHRKRRNRLATELRKEKLPALLLLNSRNIFYLTGFRGEDSALLVTGEEAILLTDSRYDEQAASETRGVRIVVRKLGLMRTAAEIARKAALPELGLEAGAITLAQAEELHRWTGTMETKPGAGLVERLRVCKDAAEMAAIRRAIEIAEEAFRRTVAHLAPGRTELEMARFLARTMEDLGAEGPSFPTIVAAAERASMPHAVPTDRIIRKGDPVLFDWGARWGGYCCDLTRMAYVARIPRISGRLHELTRTAQQKALAGIAPGRKAADIDNIARAWLKAHRHGKHFGHGLGHGVGLDIHEGPVLSRKQETILRPGMVVTVEPGIYLPRKAGVRIEDMALVTRAGRERLTSLPSLPESFLVKP